MMTMKFKLETEPEPERIGGYIIHTVASLFPLLQDEDYEGLKDSIGIHGQATRLWCRTVSCSTGATGCACLASGREPSVEESRGKLLPDEYIFG